MTDGHDQDLRQVAVATDGRRARAARRRETVTRTVEVLGLGLGVVLVVVLVFQYLDVYFVLFGEQPDVTPEAERRYLVTAAACLVLLAAGSVAALVGRHPAAVTLGVVLLVVGFVAAVLFAVPVGRWTPEPVDTGPGPDYHPCYSGSGDCLGG